MHQAKMGHVFIFGARLPVIAPRIDGNTPARRKFSPHFNVAEIKQLDEIVHDDIDAVFMKIAMVAETEKIQFQRFAFDNFFCPVYKKYTWLQNPVVR